MLHPEYVRGFIDADGCFYYNRTAKYNYVSFRVINKDIKILRELINFFGCGHVYENNHGTYKDVSEFVMQSKKELKTLLDFLREHPPIIKQKNRPRRRGRITTFDEWLKETEKYVSK